MLTTWIIFFGYGSLALGTPIPPTLQSPLRPASVPSYVLDYAPLVYLHSEDPYRPADIGSQVQNTRPEVDYTFIPGQYDLNNLDQLNLFGELYLTSKVDIITNPGWLKGVTPNSCGTTESAVTCAVITTDHGNGLVDAFYMYFYAYNWGGLVAQISSWNVGNHVGDWEHNMIRFQNGVPIAVWFSQHNNGQAFDYKALQKCGDRPIVYSANGSHANYAISGEHEHTIPNLNLPINGILMDFTDDGPLWDPITSAYFYSFDISTSTFTEYNSSYPTAWLNFLGHWGDKQYPDSDPREASNIFAGIEARYSDGPTGPIDKQLHRANVCPDNGNPCLIRETLTA
ncbi:hypothetical protein K432DRAFT_363348 [Lepidopterella palustris CBS 459.81]|uniref:Vacuolar protein sorting-associated protein 62 n=1 Tax=Lepidopterella palustris CBS 459.81 TaxID=1314670 RepID=A0A8E2DZQ4_9PEZI|nr:hypothetical protein K432DRAFT_363348 [Lepidopterella palustris CBS 459.81]